MIAALLLLGAGLYWWLTRAPQGTGPLRLTQASFADLAGWEQSDPRAALAAFHRSCAAVTAKPGTQTMGGAGYAGTVADWQAVCAAAPASAASAASARSFFQRWFAPLAVSQGSQPDGTFTGYYEAELSGSRTRHGAYQTPVYGLPSDLITVDLGLFHIDVADKTIAGILRGTRLVPYPTRADIDAHGLPSAQVLFYASDPIDVFFLHIQGSGRVKLDDGSMLRLAYAGQNGRPYTAIGRTLMARGVPRDGMSMQVIRRWLKDHPADRRAVMESDQSFVFFRVEPLGDPALGSEGAQGVGLTPGASLAVDPRLHALGAPFFVDATAPNDDPAKPDVPFRRLMVAQDIGGAIRGPVRGDVFWGFGPRAASVAGRMKAGGKFYVLLPKPVAARLGASRDFASP